MAYVVREIENLDTIDHLLVGAINEFDAIDRCRRIGFSSRQYFDHIDAAAHRRGGRVVYLVAFGDGDDPTAVGFARFVIEENFPGYNALPGDKPCMCLDEVFVARGHRGRGAFALLIDQVRKMGEERFDTRHVYARIVANSLSRACIGYGLGTLPLYIGTLHRLRLPDPVAAMEKRDEKVEQVEEYVPEGRFHFREKRKGNWRTEGGVSEPEVYYKGVQKRGPEDLVTYRPHPKAR